MKDEIGNMNGRAQLFRPRDGRPVEGHLVCILAQLDQEAETSTRLFQAIAQISSEVGGIVWSRLRLFDEKERLELVLGVGVRTKTKRQTAPVGCCLDASDRFGHGIEQRPGFGMSVEVFVVVLADDASLREGAHVGGRV